MSTKLGGLLAAGCLAAIILAGVSPAYSAAGPDPAKREFLSGYDGSPGANPRNQARTYFRAPSVKALVFQMETGPVTRARVEQALRGTDFTIADLERVRLVREREGRFYLDFAYFNAADVEAITRIAQRYVPTLVRAFERNREAFQRIFASYPVATVPKDRLAFVLLSGFTLNWDGLELTRKLGYRKPSVARGDGWEYSFWAAEDTPARSTREYYWGSSTVHASRIGAAAPADDFAFSSFGDPFSDPRMNLPDLLLTPAREMAPPLRAAATQIGLIHETRLGFDVESVIGLECARDLGALLFALRAGADTDDALRRAVRNEAKLPALLSFLEAAQYVRRRADGRYELLVPVFDVADRKMLDAAMELGRRILTRWLEESVPRLRAELGTLTAMRNGVPFEALFTQIWHDLFGLATKELVHAGITFDPYAPQLTYKGSYPAVWRASLYAHPGL